MQERHPLISLIQAHPVPQHLAPTRNEINSIIILFFADVSKEDLVKNMASRSIYVTYFPIGQTIDDFLNLIRILSEAGKKCLCNGNSTQPGPSWRPLARRLAHLMSAPALRQQLKVRVPTAADGSMRESTPAELTPDGFITLSVDCT